MTAPIETASDHLVVPDDGLVVPDDGLVVPDDGLVVPDDGLVVPDDGLVVRGSIWDPVGAVVAGDLGSPASAESEDPGAAAVHSATAEPAMAGLADAEAPSAAPVLVVVPELAPAVPVASDGPSTPWREVLAMFVDNPRSSTELAAGLVEDSVELLVESIRERQRSLLSGWQGDDAGTEEMRTAVQHYRAFWNRLDDFCRET
jgi:hypothetical protein